MTRKRKRKPKLSRKLRLRTLQLWYKSVGCHCAYCHRELLTIEQAMEIADRNRGNMSKLPLRRLPDNYPTLDHVHPFGEGGSNKLKNLAIACHKCNSDLRNTTDKTYDDKDKWFTAVDQYLVGVNAEPQPDPF